MILTLVELSCVSFIWNIILRLVDLQNKFSFWLCTIPAHTIWKAVYIPVSQQGCLSKVWAKSFNLPDALPRGWGISLLSPLQCTWGKSLSWTGSVGCILKVLMRICSTAEKQRLEETSCLFAVWSGLVTPLKIALFQNLMNFVSLPKLCS